MLLKRYELGTFPSPFAPYDQNGIVISAEGRGLRLHFETEKWAKAFHMGDHRRSDMVAGTEFSLTSEFPGEVSLELRNFAIDDIHLGYRVVVSPLKRVVTVLRFAGKKSHELARSSAIDALEPCTSRNRLELRVRGSQLIVLVNDQLVAFVNDRSFGFGCALLRFDPGGAKDVDFLCDQVELFDAI